MYVTVSGTRIPAPWFFLGVGIVWLAVLLSLVALYWSGWDWLIEAPEQITTVLPLHVPVAGALGGVTISLTGCAKHKSSWDSRWNVWHAVRPVLGAISGSLAYLVLFFVLAQVAAPGELDSEAAGTWALGFVVAFIVGFRDKYFLGIVAKVADVLFATGDEDDDVSGTVTPASVDLGEVAVGSSVNRTIEVGPVGEVATGSPPVTVTSAFAGLTVGTPTVAPGGDGRRYLVTLLWAPLETGHHQGHLVVTTPSGSQMVPVTGIAA